MPFHREVVQYPEGTNFTSINGVHFNLTALREFGYKLYSNKTISNASGCYLTFDNFKPSMLTNGTWVNTTSCYTPYYSIQGRGYLCIAFGSLFGLSIVFTLINLRKHGKLYLREDKRFRVVGRRWQWYWMLFVAACGLISTITGVDVDRYYLQDLPIILQGFFFTLMVPGALAMVWEGTRHWDSWQERQTHDEGLSILPQDDRRANTVFWLPLVFYLFAFLNFFMVIPRSWTALQKQNTEWQKENIARPAATGARIKVGAVFALCAWMVICYSLWHALEHYGQCSWRRYPKTLLANIMLLAVRLGYGVASAWNWNISVFQDGVPAGWPFGLGYAPLLLIIIVFEVAGFMKENEDKVLIQQRITRGRLNDAELNITKKPNWWQKNFNDRYLSDDQRLRHIASEVSGKTATTRRIEQSIEMGHLRAGSRSGSRPPEDPFRDELSPHVESSKPSTLKPQAPTQIKTVNMRTEMTQTIFTSNPDDRRVNVQSGQVIKSMLDV